MSELLCKVLFIDLDDTIWDFRANSVLSLRQVYDEFALKKEIPDYDRFKSLYMATNHELWELYHQSDNERLFDSRAVFSSASACR